MATSFREGLPSFFVIVHLCSLGIKTQCPDVGYCYLSVSSCMCGTTQNTTLSNLVSRKVFVITHVRFIQLLPAVEVCLIICSPVLNLFFFLCGVPRFAFVNVTRSALVHDEQNCLRSSGSFAGTGGRATPGALAQRDLLSVGMLITTTRTCQSTRTQPPAAYHSLHSRLLSPFLDIAYDVNMDYAHLLRERVRLSLPPDQVFS